MEEREVRGLLTKQEYKKAKALFAKEISKPVLQKRLSLEINNYDRHDLDTRIKITDGQPELVQKLGHWKSESREERSVKLPKDPKIILGVYRIIGNALSDTNLYLSLYHTRDYLFENKDVQVKLSHQWGNSHCHIFEVEAINPTVDLQSFCSDHGLTPNMVDVEPDFWIKFNKKVNLDAKGLSDKELLTLFKDYLV